MGDADGDPEDDIGGVVSGFLKAGCMDDDAAGGTVGDGFLE